MKLKEIINARQIIDIDTAPNTDNVYTGVCLIANSEIVMLLNFDQENGEFDGFTIVQNRDFEKFRIWEDDEYSELKNDNSENVIATIDLNSFIDLETSLKNLKSKLVTIFTYNDEDTFFVGKVLEVNNDSVELHLITQDAKWSDVESFKLNDISYLGFETSYEKEIEKNVT
ncbi:hypothetical protein SGQ44_03115 [Flavobacterium sp. Fl-77]|uniref:Uncharacterized protein n=1 Tax=Flavobacterium flavipigmentatum TaxID=2893884 RepID=A0AAJ2S903_9FLAO|nr:MULTISPECIES: hypothetical protein [unclassified Flavobacterium]MDX6181128.1 hypothetical protein [Flavobacterium sp. Fl-33]MDX6184729.1 hypothetical protein [Flavobacterium sp. Fl-77]UFH39828.1 hypothetical protein LNP22_06010 [Flavobacterium sp. F-70]